MMKLFYGATLLLFALLLVGCGSDEGSFPKEDADTVVVETDYDEHGWKGKLAVTFDGNVISDVEYDEFNQQGKAKSKDQDYEDRMVPVSGISPAEAFDELEASLEEAQDPEAMDAVTGATQSSDWFVELAERALEER
jgi:major membrane immunogen (membrane-anchored lipoprotein)